MAGKEFTQLARIWTDFAKVDGLAAGFEEQQAVEALEEQRRWLVNGAQDGLSGCSELLEEANKVPCALAV